MTCDGKVMVVTEHELSAIGLACGAADEEDFASIGNSSLGNVWLAMTDLTAYRWESGEEYPATPGYEDVAAERQAERERWYA